MLQRELPPLIGEDDSFLEAVERASQAAALDRPVLVIGERGTGKELIAARLHYLSPRWAENYVALNCAALSDALLEAELFGHTAGAFTGAARARVGRFEQAAGGTLFLDELASMSSPLQEKLLRVIEYGEFERVGSSETRKVDVRLVAAANVDLPAEAAAGRFRADLLDRLSFEVITLPPLRARAGDIPTLARHFAEAMCRELERPHFPGFSAHALRSLCAHHWPGNVRELRNVIENMVLLAQSDVLDVGDVPEQVKGHSTSGGGSPGGFDLAGRSLSEMERALIQANLELVGGNRQKAAKILGIGERTLYRKIKEYELS